MNAAPRLVELLTRLLGRQPPVRLRCWDGSEAGPAGAPLVVLRSRRALRRLCWAPGELGLAEAYISGDLDVDGDLTAALRSALPWARTLDRLRPGPRGWLAALSTGIRLGAFGPPPPAPGQRASLSGVPHS